MTLVAAKRLPVIGRGHSTRLPTRKRIVLGAVRPNEGLTAMYQKRLDALVDDMHASLLYWLTAAYRSKPPEMAQDEHVTGKSPATVMRETMARLSRRWIKRFDDSAPLLGEWFSQSAMERSDAALQRILRDAGFSVPFRMTAAANDVFRATVGEQVGLIRSIGQQHLTEVEGLVMRSVQAGRDLGTLTADIEARYDVTKRRAALIARDQNNKATATITRVRQQGLGITHAVWQHSHAGRHPRPSHVKAGADRVVYEIAKGWFDPDIQKWIWPGTEINCRCVSKPVIEGF